MRGRIHHVYGVSALLGRPCMGVGRSLWRWFLARWFKSQGTCPGDTDTAVKRLRSDQKAVYLEGGVQSSLYTSMRDYESESVYYNRDTNSYCYIGTEKPNHDSVIVGWDDDYPKENFNMELEGDGAFICTNSWGENFGDQGYFYVSYYDTNIGVHNIVYTGIEPTDNYDNIYQSDLCGWVGQIGYGEDTAWFANAYKTKPRKNWQQPVLCNRGWHRV